MNRAAVHMRIVSLDVTNQDVDACKAAATKLSEAWGRSRNKVSILQKASQIAVALGGDGAPPENLGTEVEGAIQNHASAFLHTERPLEVGICAGVAAMNLLAGSTRASGWTNADALAGVLWSALGFQRPLEDGRRETLRREVLDAARARTMETAEGARERTDVSDFGQVGVPQGNWQRFPSNFKKATSKTIDALRRNAALDREELDFLWWSQIGRSKLLDQPLHEINETVRLIALGNEAVRHLRHLPCEIHRDVVLRTLETNPESDLSELLATVGEDRESLGAAYGTRDSVVGRSPIAFPLLHALATGSTSEDGGGVKRSAAEWGARALLEASLVQLFSTGPVQL